MWTNNDTRVIKALEKKWNASGMIEIFHQDTSLYKSFFGYSNRVESKKTQANDTYLLNRRSRLLQAIVILQLIDQKRLKLNDSIAKYIPEYPIGKGITIYHLLMNESGIPDYYYGSIMLQKNTSESHQKMTEQERYINESQMFYQPISFEEVLTHIKDQVLFKAGTKDYWSSTNAYFLEVIIKRVYDMDYNEVLAKEVFKPLAMFDTTPGHHATTHSYVCMRDVNLIKADYIGDERIVWTTTLNDICKLMHGLRGRKWVSKALWKTALEPNERGDAIICAYRNGMEYYESDVLGYHVDMYIDPSSKVSFVHVSNESPMFRLIEGNWVNFHTYLRQHIELLFAKPIAPYLDHYHQRNAWDVMQLSIEDSQKEFVIEPKTALCWAYSEPKEKQSYVLMEGYRSIGYMMLAIDVEKEIYAIDVLIVDKRYQNRGYGKIMLNKGLDILKEAGAKKIEIVVNKFNIPAYKMYRALGFKETGLYEAGVRLTKYL